MGPKPQFSREQTRELLEKLWLAGNQKPDYEDCRKIGYKGGRMAWRLIRNAWLCGKGIEVKPRCDPAKIREGQQCGRKHEDIQEAIKNHHRQPIESVVELTPAQRAIKDYQVAARRVGLSRARP